MPKPEAPLLCLLSLRAAFCLAFPVTCKGRLTPFTLLLCKQQPARSVSQMLPPFPFLHGIVNLAMITVLTKDRTMSDRREVLMISSRNFSCWSRSTLRFHPFPAGRMDHSFCLMFCAVPPKWICCCDVEGLALFTSSLCASKTSAAPAVEALGHCCLAAGENMFQAWILGAEMAIHF